MDSLRKFFPIIDWISGYRKEYLRGDFSAGLTVGVLLIPQGMAYAMIAGLPPVYGLYASIVPQIAYAIFGTSRQLSVGPVAMDSLMVASGVSVLAVSGTDAYISYAIMLAFFMGAFQLFLGGVRLGFITNLLSKPVIAGFTSAAALIIGFNQLPHLLGIKLEKTNTFYRLVIDAFSHITETHWLTLVIGVLAIVAIKTVTKINKRIPGPLLVVFLGTVIVYFLRLDQSGVRIVREIPEGLPSFMLPNLEWDTFLLLLPLALTISVVAFMEAYSVAKAIESTKKDYKVVANQELIALGMSNLLGSLFQSYPVTGGFSRSAVNDRSGAITPLSSIVSAGLVAITLIFLTSLFYFLPNAVLAAIIMVAVFGLIDFKYTGVLFKTDKVEFGLLFATFLITLFFGMVPGIVSGIVLSILVLLYRAAYPHMARLGRVKGHHEFRNVRRFKDLEVWDDIIILRLDAPLEFVNIQYFKDHIEEEIERSARKPESIVIDAGPISHIDASAANGIVAIIEDLKQRNIRMVWCDLIGPVRDSMHKTGLIDSIGKENVFIDLTDAINSLKGKGNGEFSSYALQANIEE